MVHAYMPVYKMNNPELYSISNHSNQAAANYSLKKHSNFLQWNKNEEVIDIGCGDGKVTLECLLPIVSTNLKQLVAIDISPKAILFAKNQNNNEKIKFLVFDIGSRNLPPNLMNRFHHVFSFYCLHWVAQQK